MAVNFAVTELQVRTEEGPRLVDVLEEATSAKVLEVNSIEEAIASDADVLVLSLATQSRKVPSPALERLHRRKVIGVGRGAAQLFGWLDLEICSNRTLDFSSDREPEIVLELDGHCDDSASFVACRLPAVSESARAIDDNTVVQNKV